MTSTAQNLELIHAIIDRFRAPGTLAQPGWIAAADVAVSALADIDARLRRLEPCPGSYPGAPHFFEGSGPSCAYPKCRNCEVGHTDKPTPNIVIDAMNRIESACYNLPARVNLTGSEARDVVSVLAPAIRDVIASIVAADRERCARIVLSGIPTADAVAAIRSDAE